MSKYKIFAQRIGLISATNLLLNLNGIFLLPILTKNMPIQDYGTYAQIMVTIGLVPSIAMLGLSFTIVRFLPSLKKREEIQEVFYSIFFMVLFTEGIAAFLIYVFSGLIAFYLFDNNIVVVKILSILIFVQGLNDFLTDYLRAKQLIKTYSIISLINTIIQILLISFFVLRGYGILGATIGLLITSLVILLILSYIIILNLGIRLPRFTNLRTYLNFGIPTVPANLSNWIVNSSDRYVIGILLGTAYVGYYSPGYALGTTIGMFTAPFAFILPAALSEYYDNKKIEEVNKILSYSFKYFLMFSIPATFGLSLLSKSILSILSTPKIASEGFIITPLVAISTLLFGAYAIICQILILEKKTKIAGIVWIIAAILNLGLNFVLIPYFGIAGAAITTLFAFMFSFAITAYYSLKASKFDLKIPFFLKSIFASIIMSLVIVEVHPTDLFNILITICICAIVYFVVLFLLKGFEKEEFEFFKGIIRTNKASAE